MAVCCFGKRNVLRLESTVPSAIHNVSTDCPYNAYFPYRLSVFNFSCTQRRLVVKILTDTEMDAQKNSRVVENGDRDDQQLGLISSPSASVKQTLITRPSDQGKKKHTHTHTIKFLRVPGNGASLHGPHCCTCGLEGETVRQKVVIGFPFLSLALHRSGASPSKTRRDILCFIHGSENKKGRKEERKTKTRREKANE